MFNGQKFFKYPFVRGTELWIQSWQKKPQFCYVGDWSNNLCCDLDKSGCSQPASRSGGQTGPRPHIQETMHSFNIIFTIGIGDDSILCCRYGCAGINFPGNNENRQHIKYHNIQLSFYICQKIILTISTNIFKIRITIFLNGQTLILIFQNKRSLGTILNNL